MPRLSWETIVQRDRQVIAFVLATVTLIAWVDMAHEANRLQLTGVCQCMGLKMSAPDSQPWAPRELIPLSLMWTEMMVAMMLPSAAPMILLFGSVNRQRRGASRPYVPTTVFAAGYLTAWTLMSGALAILQWAIHSAALLSPGMASRSPLLGGAILIAAGGFQFTSWKHACLHHCQNPLGFVLTQWREGHRGAFLMGLKHGAYCVGCCWLLMILLFVAGVMNLWWIAILTTLVLLEKLAPKAVWLPRLTGGLLILWGIVLLSLQ